VVTAPRAYEEIERWYIRTAIGAQTATIATIQISE
jgi:hypothetical protein